MSSSKGSKYVGEKDFIHFLSNCDEVTFNKAIDYINIKGFYEGLHDHAFFDKENTLIEAMEFANSSYALVRDYWEDKFDVKLY